MFVYFTFTSLIFLLSPPFESYLLIGVILYDLVQVCVCVCSCARACYCPSRQPEVCLFECVYH